jgi:hypothetical protein
MQLFDFFVRHHVRVNTPFLTSFTVFSLSWPCQPNLMLLFVAALVEASEMFASSVVQSLLRTQHESHNGVPPGLAVTINQDGGTPAQPDDGVSFYAVN